MLLSKIAITNFRSITKTHAIEFSNYSVVVGKNNEGKSNILKAINIAMNVLRGGYKGTNVLLRRRRNDENTYIWERDFPMMLQNDPRKKKDTVIKLVFQLNPDEVDEIAKGLKSVLNGVLPIQITFTKDKIQPDIKIVKNGKGAQILDKKKKDIFQYISSQISLTYIPAIRTEDHAMDVINEMISKELSKVESDPEFQDAIKIIRKKQKPVFKKISETIRLSITGLMPSIRSVEAFIPEEEIGLSIRSSSELWIDDGIKTRVELKGDGVKSLVALSLLKDIKKDYKFSFIAIEEPESHLHPGAIRALHKSVIDLANDSQILVSTHNPLFIDTKNIQSNIVVSDGQATPATDVGQIRELLGINMSDNLSSAKYVIVVEGEDDAISLRALLSKRSTKIRNALENNTMVITSVGGSGKLNYKLGLLKNELSQYYVLLDYDEAGKTAFENAKQIGLLEARNTTFAKVRGKTESEFEDLIDINFYKEEIRDGYAINIDTKEFRSSKKKWSIALRNVFDLVGKPYEEKIEEDIKYLIAEKIKSAPDNALYGHCTQLIDGLIESIVDVFKL